MSDTPKRKHARTGTSRDMKVNVPASTDQWYRDLAAREGVTVQSLVAPVLNAYARGEIRGGFSAQPDPHGNTTK